MPDSRRKFARQLRKLGFHVEPTGRSHFRITHPDMDGFVIACGSPSDHRALCNLFGDIRRRMKRKAVA